MPQAHVDHGVTCWGEEGPMPISSPLQAMSLLSLQTFILPQSPRADDPQTWTLGWASAQTPDWGSTGTLSSQFPQMEAPCS